MKRVTGIGGVFFKSREPDKLKQWYQTHLGIECMPGNGAVFQWRDDNPDGDGYSIWSPFKADTTYFDPSPAPFMINYRVADLEALVTELKKEGVEIAGGIDESEFGKFAWVMDPEGNRIELWEPPKETPKEP
jgi:predicted enzyme related to lactoylglutathione lyase